MQLGICIGMIVFLDITADTALILGIAVIFAGGGHGLRLYILMLALINIFVIFLDDIAAYRTFFLGISLILTGGGYYFNSIAVTRSMEYMVFIAILTSCTGHQSIAVLGTGMCDCLYSFIIMF